MQFEAEAMKANCLEQLVFDIAPLDLAGVAVYVITESPAELLSPTWLGLYSRFTDLVAKDCLVAAGRWCGRGIALLVNTGEIRKILFEQVDDDPDLLEKLVHQRTLAVVLHELIHAIIEHRDTPYGHEADARKAQQAVRRFCELSNDDIDDLQTNYPPWYPHDSQWIRIMMHVAYRAERLGHRVPISLLMDSIRFAISSPWLYRNAIGNEPKRLRDLSFAQILDIQPPDAFAKTWRNDVERWVDAEPDGYEHHTLAAMRVFSSPLAEM